MNKTEPVFISTAVAVLTVSDNRNASTDSSGDYLRQAVQEAGHRVIDSAIVKDNRYAIRACLSNWIVREDIQVILVNGGTGFYAKNSTPEALLPLFDRRIDGFGELFRHLSYNTIGSAMMQSRALAGIANDTLIFAMPGSGGACRTAWQQIIMPQLDARTRPCHFVSQLKKGAL